MTIKELEIFKRLPDHKKDLVFIDLLIQNNIEKTKELVAHISTQKLNKLVDSISFYFLDNIIPFFRQDKKNFNKKIEIFDFYMSKKIPDFENDKFYVNIMNIYSPELYQAFFSKYPINTDKLIQILSHCVSKNFEPQVDWILDQVKHKKLPPISKLNERQIEFLYSYGENYIQKIVTTMAHKNINILDEVSIINQKIIKKELKKLSYLRNEDHSNCKNKILFFQKLVPEITATIINSNLSTQTQPKQQHQINKI
jgi:hypothetical protein